MKGGGLRRLLSTCFGTLAATDWELPEAKEESRSCRGVPKTCFKETGGTTCRMRFGNFGVSLL